MPLTETKETMVSEEDEVEEVDQDHDIQIVDISMEEQPHSPELAGANAKSPSISPEPQKQVPRGYCRDEIYETHEEAELIMDEAQADEEGGVGPPYVAPSARSPSPMNLAAEYDKGRMASDLSEASLESLERQRQTMAEVSILAHRARLARDAVKRNREGREERSRSRSRGRGRRQKAEGTS